MYTIYIMYRILITAQAAKSIRSMDRQTQRRIARKIDSLASEPSPPGARKLGDSERYRVRVGDYRIVYEIHDDRLVVVIVRAGHRREVYR
jgi:mRNA interferase RelE/StbE